MVKKEQNIFFAKNELNNIVLKDSKGEVLNGFIRHTEFFITNFYEFSLKISEEEFIKTKKVFVYLRTRKNLPKHLDELTTYIKHFFKDAVVVSSGEKTKIKFHIIDLFLYE